MANLAPGLGVGPPITAPAGFCVVGVGVDGKKLYIVGVGVNVGLSYVVFSQ